MCGIAGIINLSGFAPEPEILSRMIGTIAHRGPDSVGTEVNAFCGFGHRRLAVIDLAGGAQPMYSRDRRFLITFNGEIYNFRGLRAELSGLGAEFVTASDTEVVLEAVRYWGAPKAFSRLNGQFAFVLFDTATRDVFLVRDRVGEKPLYFSLLNDVLVFGSEIKAILEYFKAKNKSPALNREAFWDYLSLNYIPGGGSFVEGVESVAPGSYLHIRHKIVQRESYWTLGAQAPGTSFEPESRFSELFESAVKIRLESDVPLGIFLSGGVDSGAVLAAAVRQGAAPKAFCADFNEKSFGEGRLAARNAKMMGVEPELVSVDLGAQDLPALIERLVFHADAPLADSSALPLYLLSLETKRHVKTVLSGDGGDEVFGGYMTYRATAMHQSVPSVLRPIGPAVSRLLSLLPASNRKVGLLEKADRFLRNIDLRPALAHSAWNGMWRTEQKLRLIHPDLRSSMSFKDTFEKLASGVKDFYSPTLGELMLQDQRYYLPDDILAKCDRMGMAHGLEIRPVFLDHRLVELSAGFGPVERETWCRDKKIIKDYISRLYPSFDVRQKKQGFSIPVHLWFRTKLKDFANALFDSELRSSGLMFEPEVRRIWDLHQSRRRNYGFELWGIITALIYERNLRKQFGS